MMEKNYNTLNGCQKLLDYKDWSSTLLIQAASEVIILFFRIWRQLFSERCLEFSVPLRGTEFT